MDDKRALMELVLGNVQGGNSKLEIGIHSFKLVPLAKGGRGQEGGLREYARELSIDASNLSKYRNAAEVFLSVQENCGIDTTVLGDKDLHLNAIHKSPSSTWPSLVSALISSSWSVKETEKQVTFLNSIISSIPPWYPLELPELANIALTDDKLAKQIKSAMEEAAKKPDSRKCIRNFWPPTRPLATLKPSKILGLPKLYQPAIALFSYCHTL